MKNLSIPFLAFSICCNLPKSSPQAYQKVDPKQANEAQNYPVEMTVGRSASNGLQPTRTGSNGMGVIGSVDSNFPYQSYLRLVQECISKNWHRTNSIQARAQIYFRIMRDGSVNSIRVEIPSGSAEFDSSALLAVKQTGSLAPLPNDFKGTALGVRFWFTYLAN